MLLRWMEINHELHLRISYIFMFLQVAPIPVATIFYAISKEVSAYPKAEEIQAYPIYGERLLL